MCEEEDRKSVIQLCKEELMSGELTYPERENILNFLERDMINKSFCRMYRELYLTTLEKEVC
ncbi:MAG: hypothetical protein DRO67_01235 [Candidatus Asgardarchaeum californiense]|nr:MAG: hypothetical protein DRO67_01235 [Candidatus Asgardarchaeum californiense]